MKTYEQALNAIAHILSCAERAYSESLREYEDDKAWAWQNWLRTFTAAMETI